MILLVGANGFIGRHFRSIAGTQADVVCVRRDETAQWRSFSPREQVIGEHPFAGQAGDELIRSSTAVVYLSTRSVPGTFESDPSLEVSLNLEPAMRLFTRVASINPAARIVLASSGGTVYGGRHNGPIEEGAPKEPISAYGLVKLAVEDALAFTSRVRDGRHTILRLSNPVGRYHHNPRQGLVAAAFQAVRSGTPLTLYGSKTVRDYVDADDVAHAFLLAAIDQSATSTTLNIGAGQGTTSGEIIAMVEAVTGRSVPLVMGLPRQMDVPYVVLDCKKASIQLGWRATTPLEMTLQRMWSDV